MMISFEQALELLCRLKPENCGSKHEVFSWTVMHKGNVTTRSRLIRGHFFTQDDVDELLELLGYDSQIAFNFEMNQWWASSWLKATMNPIATHAKNKKEANEARFIAVVEYEAKQKGLIQ